MHSVLAVICFVIGAAFAPVSIFLTILAWIFCGFFFFLAMNQSNKEFVQKRADELDIQFDSDFRIYE